MTSIFTVGLVVAVFLLWSRVKQLEARISTLEADPSHVNRSTPAVVVNAPSAENSPEPPAPVPEPSVPPAPTQPSRTVTIVNRPPTPSVTGDAALEPVAEAVTEPSGPEAPAVRQPRTIGFEELFGSKLPIWAGGITLAVAGLFIIKYSIDAGLLSPAVRVVLGLIFAGVLVAGAEAARRWRQTAIDPRISQALAGAGIASAYASILMAANVYQLIGPFAGFAGLALTTAAALALALRFGSPAAVLGLAGGLAAPALVGEHSDNIAPLTAYLALVIGGLAGVGRKQRWMWLTAAALIGGFGWGLLLLAFQIMDNNNAAALAAYTLLLAFAVPMLVGGFAHERLLKAGAGILGAVQIGLIVKQGGYGGLEWAFYGLLSLGAILLARFDRKLAMLPPVALGVGLVTLLGWSQPDGMMLALVAGIGALLFAGPALADLWTGRGSLRDAIQAAVALGGAVLASAIVAPHGLSDRQWSLLALASTLPLIAFAIIGARLPLPRRDARFLALTIGAALMGCTGLVDLFDKHALPAIYALAVAGIVELWRRREDLDYRGAIAITLLATLASITDSVSRWLHGCIATLFGEPLYITTLPTGLAALTDLIAPGLILSVAAWRIGRLLPPLWSKIAFTVAGLLGVAGLFVLYKQLFAIDGAPAFKDVGLLERVILDQALFALGWLAMSRRDRVPALREFGLVLTAIGLLRVLLYNVLLFNPLWRDQLVGVVPLANLITPAFLVPLFWLALAERAEPDLARKARLPLTGLQMLLVLLFVFASVRQAFHGTLLAAGDVGQGEDICRSLAAIALAIGFLRWGIYRRERPWRIASLVLMLGAVAKVFLVDTSGLEGLLRIASFVALGFSLIGIGWLYSRHVKSDAPMEGAET